MTASEALLEATRALAQMAQREDLGRGDITALLVEPEPGARFELLLQQPAVLAGWAIAHEIVHVYDPAIGIEWAPGAADGARWEKASETPGSVTGGAPRTNPGGGRKSSLTPFPVRLAILSGPSRSVLAAERVLLNFLQRLCGVATLTWKFVDAVSGTGAKIYDTRKTTPGWRLLEKYAVRCGGGHNHRMGLYDAVLIKDNHLAGVEPERLAFAVFEMLNRLALDPACQGPAEQRSEPVFVEVEADTLEQVDQLLKVVGVNAILLDNFALPDLGEAVRRRDEQGLKGRVELEASGGITLANVAEVARTGVDRISVGALTHSAPAVDLSLNRIT